MSVDSANGFLKAVYLVCSALLLMAIAFNTVVTRAFARGVYGFVVTAFVLYFSYYLVFVRQQKGWIDILKPVFFQSCDCCLVLLCRI